MAPARPANTSVLLIKSAATPSPLLSLSLSLSPCLCLQRHTVPQSRTRGIKLPLNDQSLFIVCHDSVSARHSRRKIQPSWNPSASFFPPLAAVSRQLVLPYYRNESHSQAGWPLDRSWPTRDDRSAGRH